MSHLRQFQPMLAVALAVISQFTISSSSSLAEQCRSQQQNHVVCLGVGISPCLVCICRINACVSLNQEMREVVNVQAEMKQASLHFRQPFSLEFVFTDGNASYMLQQALCVSLLLVCQIYHWQFQNYLQQASFRHFYLQFSSFFT